MFMARYVWCTDGRRKIKVVAETPPSCYGMLLQRREYVGAGTGRTKLVTRYLSFQGLKV